MAARALRLKQAQVLAPDHGVISARTATVGAVVSQEQELFRLIRQGASSGAPKWLPRTWRESAPARPFVSRRWVPPLSGRVRMVAPTVDAATRNGLVFVDLLAPAAAASAAAPAAAPARAGMFARGEFEVGSQQALTLPQAAVLQREGFNYVFRVGADGRVQQAKVSVGRRVGERIEITGGLDAGARVVAQGAGFLGDGDLVRVVEAAAVPPASSAPAAPAAGGSPSPRTSAPATAPVPAKK
ncbi:MAG: hypothetical protein U1F49_02360 [Rubrivivax sp.]